MVIAKTFSFILYAKLSSFIIEYNISKDFLPKYELSNLLKVPKIIYWTLKSC